MTAKDVKFGADARERMLRGVPDTDQQRLVAPMRTLFEPVIIPLSIAVGVVIGFAARFFV
jgi:hypothetical protein